MCLSGYVGRESGRFLSMVRPFVLALVLIAIAPTVAFAAQYGDVVYGPAVTGLGNGEYYVQVYAFNKYEAAAAALGNNVRDETIFTDDVKAKLSNESTGGDFYDFAQKFTDDEYGVTDPITSSAADVNMLSAYRLNVDMYGRNSVFWAKFTESEAGAASAALARVAAGESGGSGSEEPQPNSSVPESLDLTYYYMPDNRELEFDYQSLVYHLVLSSDARQALSAYIGSCPYVTALVEKYFYKNGSNRNSGDVWLFLSEAPPTVTDGSNGAKTVSFGRCYYKNVGITGTLSGNVVALDWISTSYSSSYSYDLTLSGYRSGNTYYACGLGGGGGTPTVPPTNWPDDGDPVAPSPPELPDPSPPETPNPPQDPTPSPNPTYNVEINYPDFTYVTADLSAILEAMNSHCEHLRHALYDNLTEFWRLLSTKLTNDFATLRTFLANQFSWQTSAIEGYFDDLSDYLYDLFHWLADQFDFTFGSGDSGYDDTSLLYWLKRIYYKLGTGTTIKPTDPVVQPDDWWKWLEQLFNNFVMDLLALGANGLADVMDGLRTLITKFPFSMPWDIAAILGLLVSQPVTPSVTWPIYSVSSGFQLSQVGTMTIDLDDYSDVWEGVRNMERIAFAVFLAWHINKFTDMMPSKEKTI